MAKVKIHVAKPFKLLGKDGQAVDFAVGNHTVEQAVAEHWFVKAHTGDEPAAVGDTEAAADELLAELEVKAKALQEAADALAAREATVVQRERAAEALHADLVERENAVTAREQAAEAKAKEEAEAKAKADAEAKPAAKTSK